MMVVVVVVAQGESQVDDGGPGHGDRSYENVRFDYLCTVKVGQRCVLMRAWILMKF